MNNTKLTLALMAGLPAAGKTTIACALGRLLDWHIIDKDGHKLDLLKQGLDDWDASKAAYDWSFDTARDVLTKRQSSVILDSPALHSFIIEHAREIVNRIENVQLKILLCVADRDLRNHRLRSRSAQQLTIIRVDPVNIADYFRCFNHLPPDSLKIYTNNPLEECIIQAKNYLIGKDFKNLTELDSSAFEFSAPSRVDHYITT